MKILLTFAVLISSTLSFAAGPVSYSSVSGTITTTTWTELVSGTPLAASSIMISNTGTSFLILGLGASGSVVNTGLVIPPSAGPILIPMSIRKNSRLSLKALHNNSTGAVGVVFFQ